MSSWSYYNEIDEYAAAWLRNLIRAGHIAPGEVDTRSIEDVRPSDLRGFTQCHFFAGIGVWSLALRKAGWADTRPVWTGSCPCQPFSAAGKGAGFDDERHLWPHFHHLIRERRPSVVLGEQVASKDAGPWIDLVCADMEAMGYAFGAVPFPSAGVGAPHIRDRLYWVGNTSSSRLERHAGHGGSKGWERPSRSAATTSVSRGLAHTAGRFHRANISWSDQRPLAGSDGTLQAGSDTAGPTNGLWANPDWLLCRDGWWRPVEPGTFPLAHGAPARVGRLRAYGNSINAKAGEVFIRAVMESIDAY